jgi:Cof subfamily protein (haloacid dehalogenase superfamily)
VTNPDEPTGPVRPDTLPDVAPRLVATDLDGTLVRPDGSVSGRTADALAAAEDAGVTVVFVTARPPRWILELAPHVAGHGLAICANGAALVRVATGEVLAERGLPAALVAEIVGDVRDAWGPAAAQFALERTAGFAIETAYDSFHGTPPGTPVADRIEDVVSANTLKLLVQTTARLDEPFHDALARVVGDRAIVADSGEPRLGEISAPGVTKAATLAQWCSERGIGPEQVWAVGDAPNDLPMLAWAGTSFAVGNAHPQVLAAADHVVPSNADDGVAELLERAVALGGRLGSTR